MLSTTLGPAAVWNTWDDEQRDIADDLENTVIYLRSCVNCAPDDAVHCAKARERLSKLEARVGPLSRDAGRPTEKAAAPAAKAAPPSNLPRLRQCCGALSSEAKRLGSSPEAAQMNSAAAQCNALGAAAGPGGSVPENGTLRALLAGRTIPAACAGF
ncbi:MAG: hypothetical protein KF764_25450 [Labilithrix sp.]|nr:hypothetical protein [Labilithrix sp.]